jgi:Fic family protein
MRKYEESHPWLTFKFDLRRFSEAFWMSLGEVQSKCEHISGSPLKPDVQKRLHELFLAKGAQATTAIEGNTLSEKEVLDQLEGKLQLPRSKEYMGQAIDNIVEACNYIARKLQKSEELSLSIDDIKKYNKFVLQHLPLEDGVIPGELNIRPVGISGANYRGAPPEDCEYLLNRLCHWLNDEFPKPEKENIIAWGIIKAIIAHVYFVWIHPFGDGNGRTARLIELQILLDACVPTPAAHLLSNFYNETREEYYRQLFQSSKSGGNVNLFIEYAVIGFVDQLRGQIKIIRDKQWEIAWRDYIYDVFAEKTKASDKRKRDLALELSKLESPIPIAKLIKSIPKIELLYFNKSSQNLINDINALIQLGILEMTDNGPRAKKEIILAFLPIRREPR